LFASPAAPEFAHIAPSLAAKARVIKIVRFGKSRKSSVRLKSVLELLWEVSIGFKKAT
jgi:hypothetical protein